MKTNRSIAAAMLTGAIMIAPSHAVSGQIVAQLPQGDPAKKLAVLHMQEVYISQIVASVCFVDAGVEAERNRVIAYAARDAFQNTLPDIVAEVNALDSSNPAVRRLKREIESKKEMWYRFRVFFERELKAENPSADVLAQLSLVEGNLTTSIEKIYRLVKKKMAKEGKVDLGTMLQEQATFNMVFKAQRAVTEACLVAAGVGDALERAKLGEAVEHLEQELSVAAQSPIVSGDTKALIPAWQAILEELRSLATGGKPAPDLLPRLDELQNQWEAAMGVSNMISATG
ncbi:MAG: hypothetical protein AAF713_22340 [Pseudomonadota bacterium]